MIAEAAAINQENNWDAYRGRAGFETYAIAGLIFILPKIGPLKMVAVKGPTTATEADYMHSLALSIAIFRRMLGRFTPPAAGTASDGHASPAALASIVAAASPDELLVASDPAHPLPNRDLDTGRLVQPGGYRLTDFTYALLLHRLVEDPTLSIPPQIKRDIQAYYANADAPIATKKDPQKWAEVQAELNTLASMPTSTEPQPYPTYGEDAQKSQ
jgi:hypothetical protein